MSKDNDIEKQNRERRASSAHTRKSEILRSRCTIITELCLFRSSDHDSNPQED